MELFNKEYMLKITDKEFLKAIYHRTAMRQNEDIIKQHNLYIPKLNLKPGDNATLLANTYDVFEVLTFIHSLKKVYATVDWESEDTVSQQLSFHALLRRLAGPKYTNHLFYLVQNEFI